MTTLKEVEIRLLETEKCVAKLQAIAQSNKEQIDKLFIIAASNEKLLKFVVTPLIIIVGALAGVNLVS